MKTTQLPYRRWKLTITQQAPCDTDHQGDATTGDHGLDARAAGYQYPSFLQPLQQLLGREPSYQRVSGLLLGHGIEGSEVQLQAAPKHQFAVPAVQLFSTSADEALDTEFTFSAAANTPGNLKPRPAVKPPAATQPLIDDAAGTVSKTFMPETDVKIGIRSPTCKDKEQQDVSKQEGQGLSMHESGLSKFDAISRGCKLFKEKGREDGFADSTPTLRQLLSGGFAATATMPGICLPALGNGEMTEGISTLMQPELGQLETSDKKLGCSSVDCTISMEGKTSNAIDTLPHPQELPLINQQADRSHNHTGISENDSKHLQRTSVDNCLAAAAQPHIIMHSPQEARLQDAAIKDNAISLPATGNVHGPLQEEQQQQPLTVGTTATTTCANDMDVCSGQTAEQNKLQGNVAAIGHDNPTADFVHDNHNFDVACVIQGQHTEQPATVTDTGQVGKQIRTTVESGLWQVTNVIDNAVIHNLDDSTHQDSMIGSFSVSFQLPSGMVDTAHHNSIIPDADIVQAGLPGSLSFPVVQQPALANVAEGTVEGPCQAAPQAIADQQTIAQPVQYQDGSIPHGADSTKNASTLQTAVGPATVHNVCEKDSMISVHTTTLPNGYGNSFTTMGIAGHIDGHRDSECDCDDGSSASHEHIHAVAGSTSLQDMAAHPTLAFEHCITQLSQGEKGIGATSQKADTLELAPATAATASTAQVQQKLESTTITTVYAVEQPPQMENTCKPSVHGNGIADEQPVVNADPVQVKALADSTNCQREIPTSDAAQIHLTSKPQPLPVHSNQNMLQGQGQQAPWQPAVNLKGNMHTSNNNQNMNPNVFQRQQAVQGQHMHPSATDHQARYQQQALQPQQYQQQQQQQQRSWSHDRSNSRAYRMQEPLQHQSHARQLHSSMDASLAPGQQFPNPRASPLHVAPWQSNASSYQGSYTTPRPLQQQSPAMQMPPAHTLPQPHQQQPMLQASPWQAVDKMHEQTGYVVPQHQLHQQQLTGNAWHAQTPPSSISAQAFGPHPSLHAQNVNQGLLPDKTQPFSRPHGNHADLQYQQHHPSVWSNNQVQGDHNLVSHQASFQPQPLQPDYQSSRSRSPSPTPDAWAGQGSSSVWPSNINNIKPSYPHVHQRYHTPTPEPFNPTLQQPPSHAYQTPQTSPQHNQQGNHLSLFNGLNAQPQQLHQQHESLPLTGRDRPPAPQLQQGPEGFSFDVSKHPAVAQGPSYSNPWAPNQPVFEGARPTLADRIAAPALPPQQQQLLQPQPQQSSFSRRAFNNVQQVWTPCGLVPQANQTPQNKSHQTDVMYNRGQTSPRQTTGIPFTAATAQGMLGSDVNNTGKTPSAQTSRTADVGNGASSSNHADVRQVLSKVQSDSNRFNDEAGDAASPQIPSILPVVAENAANTGGVLARPAGGFKSVRPTTAGDKGAALLADGIKRDFNKAAAAPDGIAARIQAKLVQSKTTAPPAGTRSKPAESGIRVRIGGPQIKRSSDDVNRLMAAIAMDFGMGDGGDDAQTGNNGNKTNAPRFAMLTAASIAADTSAAGLTGAPQTVAGSSNVKPAAVLPAQHSASANSAKAGVRVRIGAPPVKRSSEDVKRLMAAIATDFGMAEDGNDDQSGGNETKVNVPRFSMLKAASIAEQNSTESPVDSPQEHALQGLSKSVDPAQKTAGPDTTQARNIGNGARVRIGAPQMKRSSEDVKRLMAAIAMDFGMEEGGDDVQTNQTANKTNAPRFAMLTAASIASTTPAASPLGSPQRPPFTLQVATTALASASMAGVQDGKDGLDALQPSTVFKSNPPTYNHTDAACAAPQPRSIPVSGATHTTPHAAGAVHEASAVAAGPPPVTATSMFGHEPVPCLPAPLLITPMTTPAATPASPVVPPCTPWSESNDIDWAAIDNLVLVEQAKKAQREQKEADKDQQLEADTVANTPANGIGFRTPYDTPGPQSLACKFDCTTPLPQQTVGITHVQDHTAVQPPSQEGAVVFHDRDQQQTSAGAGLVLGNNDITLADAEPMQISAVSDIPKVEEDLHKPDGCSTTASFKANAPQVSDSLACKADTSCDGHPRGMVIPRLVTAGGKALTIDPEQLANVAAQLGAGGRERDMKTAIHSCVSPCREAMPANTEAVQTPLTELVLPGRALDGQQEVVTGSTMQRPEMNAGDEVCLRNSINMQLVPVPGIADTAGACSTVCNPVQDGSNDKPLHANMAMPMTNSHEQQQPQVQERQQKERKDSTTMPTASGMFEPSTDSTDKENITVDLAQHATAAACDAVKEHMPVVVEGVDMPGQLPVFLPCDAPSDNKGNGKLEEEHTSTAECMRADDQCISVQASDSHATDAVPHTLPGLCTAGGKKLSVDTAAATAAKALLAGVPSNEPNNSMQTTNGTSDVMNFAHDHNDEDSAAQFPGKDGGFNKVLPGLCIAGGKKILLNDAATAAAHALLSGMPTTALHNEAASTGFDPCMSELQAAKDEHAGMSKVTNRDAQPNLPGLTTAGGKSVAVDPAVRSAMAALLEGADGDESAADCANTYMNPPDHDHSLPATTPGATPHSNRRVPRLRRDDMASGFKRPAMVTNLRTPSSTPAKRQNIGSKSVAVTPAANQNLQGQMLAGSDGSGRTMDTNNMESRVCRSADATPMITKSTVPRIKRKAFVSPTMTKPRKVLETSAGSTSLKAGKSNLEEDEEAKQRLHKKARLSLPHVGEGNGVHRMSLRQAVAMTQASGCQETPGIATDVLSATASNAANYRFPANLPGSKASEMQVDGVMDHERTETEITTWGVSEAHKELLAAGALPHHATETWVANHYCWIVWKLAAYKRTMPMLHDASDTASSCSFTRSGVLQQLQLRYNREVCDGQHSAIHRIAMRESNPSATMTVVVSAIIKPTATPANVQQPATVQTTLQQQPNSSETGSERLHPQAAQPHQAHLQGQKQAQQQESKEQKQAICLEVTDGWYPMLLRIDEPLARLVQASAIREGCKLRISGAVYDGGSGEALEPLAFMQTGAGLRVEFNGCSPASWDAPLGQPRKPLSVFPLCSVHPEGGTIPHTVVVIQALYAVQVWDKLGGRSTFRTEKEHQTHMQRLAAAMTATTSSKGNGDEYMDTEYTEQVMDTGVRTRVARVSAVLPPGRQSTGAQLSVQATMRLWRVGSHEGELDLQEGGVYLVSELKPQPARNKKSSNQWQPVLELQPSKTTRWLHLGSAASMAAGLPLDFEINTVQLQLSDANDDSSSKNDAANKPAKDTTTSTGIEQGLWHMFWPGRCQCTIAELPALLQKFQRFHEQQGAEWEKQQMSKQAMLAQGSPARRAAALAAEMTAGSLPPRPWPVEFDFTGCLVDWGPVIAGYNGQCSQWLFLLDQTSAHTPPQQQHTSNPACQVAIADSKQTETLGEVADTSLRPAADDVLAACHDSVEQNDGNISSAGPIWMLAVQLTGQRGEVDFWEKDKQATTTKQPYILTFRHLQLQGPDEVHHTWRAAANNNTHYTTPSTSRTGAAGLLASWVTAHPDILAAAQAKCARLLSNGA